MIGPLVIAAISLVLAGISLLIWWRQRDPPFGLYALAEIAWAVSLAEFFLTDAPLPRIVWQVTVLASRAIFMLATARFAFIVIDVRARWPGWLVNAFLWLKLPLIVLMASVLNVSFLKIADWGVNVVMACCVGGALVWSAWQRPNQERIVLAGAVGLATVLTSADFTRIWLIGDFYWDTALTKYLSLLFSMAMAWLLVDRYTRTSRLLADLNRDLDQKVAQKERELHQLYAHSREVEREQAALRERSRIMRDMHDGLGSTLVGTLSLLRSGQSSSAALLKHLQQALDALKLSVDAMQETRGDLAVVLGNLRYRLRERLEAASLTVDWQVDRLPTVAGLTPQIVRELQYLLLEAFSNVMQHAGGGVVQVIARSAPPAAHGGDAILIEIRDNGSGFDTTATTMVTAWPICASAPPASAANCRSNRRSGEPPSACCSIPAGGKGAQARPQVRTPAEAWGSREPTRAECRSHCPAVPATGASARIRAGGPSHRSTSAARLRRDRTWPKHSAAGHQAGATRRRIHAQTVPPGSG